mmetsp:Transcript_1319/g.2199  ORF Transcript_1319/g.2199 Transcript_1319/m.2199 type:complete len:87 (+) Transcript_1319:34-294(+)
MKGEKEKNHQFEYLVAGGIAGIVSRTCIAPIERVKILYQITKASPNAESLGYWRIVPRIYREEGLLAFWKGNSVAVIRVVPYMSIT